MGKSWKLETKLGLGYALGAIANALLLAVAVYGLSLVSDPFFFYFASLFLLLVAFSGYLAGRFMGRRIEQKNERATREMRDQLDVMKELSKANEFLETETVGLKKHRQALLSIMEDAERYNKKLKREIIERKRAQAETAQVRNNMELVLHGGDLGYWNWEIETDRYSFNERSLSILGSTDTELKEVSDWRERYIHEEDLPPVQRRCKNIWMTRARFIPANTASNGETNGPGSWIGAGLLSGVKTGNHCVWSARCSILPIAKNLRSKPRKLTGCSTAEAANSKRTSTSLWA